MNHASLSVRVEIDPLIERLLRRTAMVLDRAELDEELEHVVRVIDAHRILEARSIGNASLHIGLAPFAELALRETIDIGSDQRLDSATKARRINEIFRLSGMTTGSCA